LAMTRHITTPGVSTRFIARGLGRPAVIACALFGGGVLVPAGGVCTESLGPAAESQATAHLGRCTGLCVGLAAWSVVTFFGQDRVPWSTSVVAVSRLRRIRGRHRYCRVGQAPAAHHLGGHVSPLGASRWCTPALPGPWPRTSAQSTSRRPQRAQGPGSFWPWASNGRKDPTDNSAGTQIAGGTWTPNR